MAEITVGKKAPTFTSKNANDETVKLADLVGKEGVVLYFYPRDMTPGCTTEACDFRDNFARIKKLGYNVVGISKDTPKAHTKFIEKEKLNLIRKNIRFEAIGDLDKLPLLTKNEVQKAIVETQVNTGLHLTFALSYGSRWEITEACKAIARKVAEGSLDPKDIDESLVSAHLFTYPNPSPDLVIRTSGEKRTVSYTHLTLPTNREV